MAGDEVVCNLFREHFCSPLVHAESSAGSSPVIFVAVTMLFLSKVAYSCSFPVLQLISCPIRGRELESLPVRESGILL